MSTPTSSAATTRAARTTTPTDRRDDPPAGDLVRRWLALAATAIGEAAPELTELDARIGDGDHGINLGRGMAGVADVAARADADGGSVLIAVGRHLVSTVGGASGPLYGTLFLEAGAALGPTGRASDLGVALRAGVAGVGRRGRSVVGQKTMLDTLVPAARTLDEALETGRSVAEACAAAARVARAGCASTAPMVAQRGRASYLGERAIGHLDPGAVSSRLLIEALALAAQDVARSGAATAVRR